MHVRMYRTFARVCVCTLLAAHFFSSASSTIDHPPLWTAISPLACSQRPLAQGIARQLDKQLEQSALDVELSHMQEKLT
eukprot:9228953-Pyramimonas_sp.AAC.2